jgi:hypothetical protein
MRKIFPLLVIISYPIGSHAQPIFPTVPGRPPATKSASATDTIKFQNGDLLHGDLVGFNKDKGVVWRHPGIKQLLHITLGSLAEITLIPRKTPATKTHRDHVQLVNGDKISGDLIKLDDKQLILKTWYAGPLAINRSKIRALLPGETGGKLVYEGPADAKGWVNNSGTAILTKQKAATGNSWRYHEGGFDSKGSSAVLARKFPKLPDRANIEFDLNWASSPSIYINLCTDNFSGYTSGNSYCLRLSRSSALLYKYTSNQNQRRSARVGNTVKLNLSSTTKSAHISLRIDQAEHSIALVINGHLITQWIDNGQFAGLGKGLMFTSRTSTPMRLSSIRISHWDSGLPPTLQTGTNSGPNDSLRLTNKDSLSGQLGIIRDGKVTFRTPFSENLTLPLERVSVVTFARGGIPSVTSPGSIRITMENRVRLTAQLLNWENDKVTLKHPAIGEMTINANAIVEINFQNTKTSQPNNDPSVNREF